MQLASSQKEKLIKKYYEENDIKGQGGYYHYIRNGVDRYALIYGTYDSVSQMYNYLLVVTIAYLQLQISLSLYLTK